MRLSRGIVQAYLCLGASRMIEELKRYLISHRFLKESSQNQWSARLTGNWSVICFENKKPRYYIKLQRVRSLTSEFKALEQWHSKLPKNILRPLQFGTLGDQQLYIQDAQLHRSLNQTDWLKRDHLRHDMMNFFQASSSAAGSTFMPRAELLSPWQGKGISQGLACVESLSLPSLAQHGDLTLTNLGVHADLLIFDWEDYGVSQYPLLDLTSFMMSLHDFQLDKLYYTVLQTHNQWLETCLSLYSCTALQFLQCLPYSLAEFLDLKIRLGYGKEVIHKTKVAVESSLAFNQELFDA